MSYPLVKVPKPKRRTPKGLTRTRMKSRNAKRKGSAFPKMRDAKYRRWIWTENPCMLAGRVIGCSLSPHDVSQGLAWRGFKHVCWGANTPAHVGQHQAKGAPDFGVLVPLCKAAHQFYDEHRRSWFGVTGWTEAYMASAASGYALKYVELGNAPSERETPNG